MTDVFDREFLETRIDITDAEISEALEHPSDFGYSGDTEEMFITWSLGPVIRTRDSSLLEQSNADALEAALAESVESGLLKDEDFHLTCCNHWACGWVDHLSFRAIESEESREPTLVFRFIMAWTAMLSDYPVADDEDFSKREWEYAIECIGELTVSHTAPEDWATEVASNMNELPRENYGNEEEAKRVALELGFLACDECDGDGWVLGDHKQLRLFVDKDSDDFRERREFDYTHVTCPICIGDGVAREATNG